jgi:hypothetical protein
MIIGLQIMAFLFALVMIYFALMHFKRKEIEWNELIAWVVMWVVTIVIVLFPQLLRTYTDNFAVTRLFDLMVICGFVVVITLTSINYVRSKKIEKKLEEYIREDAVKKAKRKIT